MEETGGVLRVELGVMVDNNHNLRLRRIRNRETEDESQSDPILFHA